MDARCLRQIVPGLGLLAMLLWGATAAAAMSSTGEGPDLWIAMDIEQTEGLRLYHRHRGDEPGVVRHAADLSGRLVPGAMAARGRSLWVLRRDGTIQQITAVRSEIDGQWTYRVSPGRRLPAGVTPRALTIGPNGPWLMVRVESAKTLAELESQAENKSPPLDPRASRRNRAMGLPPNFRLAPAPAPPDNATPVDDLAEVETEAMKPEAVKAERLIHLERGRWVARDLPRDWSPASEASLVWARSKDAVPWLMVWPVEGQSARLWRWQDEAWNGETIDGLPPSGRYAAAVVDRQVVVGAASSDRSSVTLYLVRAGAASELATVDLASPRPDGWRLAGSSQTVAVLSETTGRSVSATAVDVAAGEAGDSADAATLGVVMTEVDLRGNVESEQVTLRVAAEPPMLSKPDRVVMTAVLVVATVLMLVFWRRDPKRNRLILPADYQLAGMTRRAMAGLIDLAPGMILVLLVFGVEPMSMRSQWPAQPHAGSWEAMFPGLTLIAVTVLHTMIGEMLNGQSLGKRFTGLHVRSLTGRKASASQVALRCLLKAFDLVAPLLLLLPVIGPFRQRLGDLVARTVVLMPKPEEESADDNGGEDDA